MKRACTTLKRAIVGGAAIAAVAVAGTTFSSAQETTTDSETTLSAQIQAYEAAKADETTSSDLEVCEAVQRTDARFKKWVEQGIPEEFGSEEPFTFDPALC